MKDFPAGPELDYLIATKVMKWVGDSERKDVGLEGYGFCPSQDIVHAWQVVKKLAPFAGDFEFADGFFTLKYAESADHGDDEAGCTVPHPNPDADKDTHPWSCHFHLGALGEQPDGVYPPGWDHGAKFCARGTTAPHAICLAALKAVGS